MEEFDDPLFDYEPGPVESSGEPDEPTGPFTDPLADLPEMLPEDTYAPEDPYFTFPPPEEDHGSPWQPPAREHREAGMPDVVLDTLRRCVAAHHGATGQELTEFLAYVRASHQVMKYLDETRRKTHARLAEILISEYVDAPARPVDLDHVEGITAASKHVQGELAVIIAARAGEDLPKVPTAAWRALVEQVQRIASKQAALAMVAAIDAGETNVECTDLFRAIEPPSAVKSLVNQSISRTAAEWEAVDRAAEAESAGVRISSGYPTLDFAFTQKDARGRDIEPRGTWGPGELHIFAAPTGHGKSAFARKLITAALEDLVVGWGREHDKVLMAITEETPKIVYTVAGMGTGQPFHHLADNLVIAAIGASRRRLIHAVWDCVIDAFHRAKETGLSIANAGLPAFIIVDYVGGIMEDGEGADTTAIEKTANLLMRGLAGWDVQMMEEFSGESFAAYAGMAWPTGMESFRPSILGFAQFRKLADPLTFNSAGRGVAKDDFVVPNANGEPGWEVLDGDFRLPTQGEIRGSGVLINHATSLIIGHRSRPTKNPKVIDPVTGKVRLTDDRARLLLVKTRNSTDLPFIPMRFDSTPSGLRGQYYDLHAERAVELGVVRPTECYREEGDPILPTRPVRTPFDGIAY